MNKIKAILLATLGFGVITAAVFTSCQRERDEDTSDTADVMLFERESDDIMGIMEQAYKGQLGQYKTRGCGNVTLDTLSTPRVITVDFGTSNCLCKDNKNRRGKVIITYTGAYRAAGTVRTVTFNNYYVNDNKIRGYKKVSNNGPNSAGNITFTVESKDSIDLPNNAGRLTCESLREREYIAGANTAQWIDDKYSVTGSANGVRANGFTWSNAITKPVIVEHSCMYRMTSGELAIQPQGKALRTLNFGNGTCDNEATVTINNKSFAVKFK